MIWKRCIEGRGSILGINGSSYIVFFKMGGVNRENVEVKNVSGTIYTHGGIHIVKRYSNNYTVCIISASDL